MFKSQKLLSFTEIFTGSMPIAKVGLAVNDEPFAANHFIAEAQSFPA